MFKTSGMAIAIIAAQLCSYSYGKTRAALYAETPVRIRTVQDLSAAMRPGEHVEFQVAAAVLVGGDIVIPRGARAVGEIESIDRTWLRQVSKLQIRLLYAVAASGADIPIRSYRRSSRHGRTTWAVRVEKETEPAGAETRAYVSIEMDAKELVASASQRPGGTDRFSEARPERALNYFGHK